jgi:iron complex transport system permease protein
MLLLLCFAGNISLGSVHIPLATTVRTLLGYNLENSSFDYIIWNYRLPKALTAILVGSGLSVSGLLMQTLFRNPLAGPFVLGISSGASLGAAILIMGSGFLTGIYFDGLGPDLTLAVAASLGSLLVLFLILGVAAKVKDTMALLIIGLMFGSITSALVSVLSYFSTSDQLQRFIFWSYGSIGNLTWGQLLLLFLISVIGLLLALFTLKSLNAFLMGDRYAQSMGVNLKRTKYGIIMATGLLAGGVTAFAGPIAFIGLAVPHVARQFFETTDHKVLLPAVGLCGAVVMLICDSIAQLPGSASVLPINAVTSLFGAPIVIWLLVKREKIIF